MHYFPDPDTPDLQPFTQAFVHLMFAHAEFERRVSDLMGVITCQPDYGERPENRRFWSAKQRPMLIKKLINEHQRKRVGGLPERAEIVTCLRRAIAPSDDRNMLAHGHWWAFNAGAGSITVRATTDWPNSEKHRDFTVLGIREAIEKFEQLETELFFLQRRIEQRGTVDDADQSNWFVRLLQPLRLQR
jgi:hypothetical protein